MRSLLCLILILAAPRLCAAGDAWSSLGPEGGAISSMAIDPQNQSILYAATLTGRVFKSTNGGAGENADSAVWVFDESGAPMDVW